MTGDTLRIRLVSSDISARLQTFVSQGMRLEKVTQEDLLTAAFTLSRKDFSAVKKYAKSRGDEITVLSTQGPGNRLHRAVKRPVLTCCLLFLLFLTCWLPTRVLFIRLEGNTNVAPQEILQWAQASGIRFGASVRQVRSEQVKNRILEAIPELSWVGINTKGCVATIHVAQREISQLPQEQSRISSLVAVRDALVTELTVTQGNALCKPGQVVRKGQVLISGYTDCGLKIQATNAQGEVFAQTRHNRLLVFPTDLRKKQEISHVERNYFLQIGKKEINLWKDSGISGMVCDKMYATHYVCLPGGFYLPLGITVQTCVYYETAPGQPDPEHLRSRMEILSRQDLLGDMISGQILSQKYAYQEMDGFHQLTGSYLCREMIGRIQQEEIAQHYEQNNGEGRQR